MPTKLEYFWNVEEIGITDYPQCSDNDRAMGQFRDTLKTENGRCQGTWPWEEEIPDLLVNRELAVGRLKSVVSKLKSKTEFLQKYNLVLKGQLE